MLLNQAQYKENTRILNKLADEIQTLIDDVKTNWSEKENEDEDEDNKWGIGNSLQRGIYLGKLGAFTTCLQLFRNRADGAYKMEMEAADVKILNYVKQIENQIQALKNIAEKIEAAAPNSGANLILDQAALLEIVPKDIKLILRQTGSKTK